MLNHLLVLLLVAFFKPDLRVLDDAHGVNDESRSAECVLFAKFRLMAVEKRVGDFHFIGQLDRRLALRVHSNYEDLKAVFAIFLMEFLEMNHLLARKRSVPRKEKEHSLGSRLLAGFIPEDQLAIFAGKAHRFFVSE